MTNASQCLRKSFFYKNLQFLLTKKVVIGMIGMTKKVVKMTKIHVIGGMECRCTIM